MAHGRLLLLPWKQEFNFAAAASADSILALSAISNGVIKCVVGVASVMHPGVGYYYVCSEIPLELHRIALPII